MANKSNGFVVQLPSPHGSHRLQNTTQRKSLLDIERPTPVDTRPSFSSLRLAFDGRNRSARLLLSKKNQLVGLHLVLYRTTMYRK